MRVPVANNNVFWVIRYIFNPVYVLTCYSLLYMYSTGVTFFSLLSGSINIFNLLIGICLPFDVAEHFQAAFYQLH